MSGHSHFATIHRQKELKDASKGKIFSKLARSITIAAKSAGGTNPDFNFKLRMAIDKAKEASMPKENIDRALSKAENGGDLEEVTYEGFGPAGILVVVEGATDNRNRTSAEIKNLFEKNGGKMGTPGSVSFNFAAYGLILIKKENPDEQTLKLIDIGVEDIEEVEDGLEIYVAPNLLSDFQKKITQNGFEVKSSELIQKPKSLQDIPDDKKEQIMNFLENLENHDDVQKVHTNANL